MSKQVMTEQATAPDTPSSGKVIIYAKTDGLMYSKDDTGTETAMTNQAQYTNRYGILYNSLP